MNIADRIERIVRDWPQWSPAERARMDDLIAEVLAHCRNGTGNGFIRSWCERVLAPKMGGLILAELDAASATAADILKGTK